MTATPPDKRCDWPEEPPGSGRYGCGEPVWFRPTAKGRQQVTDADGRDHHQTCRAFQAQVARQRAEREQAAAEAEAATPRLFPPGRWR
jgi:hypothetical protein